MNTVYIVLPVHNPKMLNQEDLKPYETENFSFKVVYTDMHLKELNTGEDVQAVIPSVWEKIKQAKELKACAVLVYAFGDVVDLKEAEKLISIPVIGLGRLAVQLASSACQKKYTVVPVRLSHNGFIEMLVKDEGLGDRFAPADEAIELDPAQISELRGSMEGKDKVLNRLVEVLDRQIKKGIDTFTFGCGSLIGFAGPLQEKLQELYKNKIIKIIDIAKESFDVVKSKYDQPVQQNSLTNKDEQKEGEEDLSLKKVVGVVVE